VRVEPSLQPPQIGPSGRVTVNGRPAGSFSLRSEAILVLPHGSSRSARTHARTHNARAERPREASRAARVRLVCRSRVGLCPRDSRSRSIDLEETSSSSSVIGSLCLSPYGSPAGESILRDWTTFFSRHARPRRSKRKRVRPRRNGRSIISRDLRAYPAYRRFSLSVARARG